MVFSRHLKKEAGLGIQTGSLLASSTHWYSGDCPTPVPSWKLFFQLRGSECTALATFHLAASPRRTQGRQSQHLGNRSSYASTSPSPSPTQSSERQGGTGSENSFSPDWGVLDPSLAHPYSVSPTGLCQCPPVSRECPPRTLHEHSPSHLWGSSVWFVLGRHRGRGPGLGLATSVTSPRADRI